MWQLHGLIALDIARERAREAQQQALADQARALVRSEARAHGRVRPSRPRVVIARSLRAGMVYVNCYDADDITVPFGGFKQSGIGRDKSLHAFEKFTQVKTTWIQLG